MKHDSQRHVNSTWAYVGGRDIRLSKQAEEVGYVTSGFISGKEILNVSETICRVDGLPIHTHTLGGTL